MIYEKMNEGKVLFKNTAIVSIGKICTQLITFFLLPIYTAMLTNEQYGVVDLLNTLTRLLLPIVTLQIEQGVFRYLIDYREYKEKQISLITTMAKFICIQVVVYALLFFGINQFMNNEYKYLLAVNLFINIFSNLLLQISRGLGDNKKYAIGSFIAGVLTVILNILFIVAFKWGAYGMIGANIIGNVVCGLYIFVSKKIYKYIKVKQYDKNLLKEVLKYSIPLIPNIISWWIVNVSDRIIITSIIGIEQNGIYSVSNKFSHVFTTLYSAFNLTWTESAAVNINSEHRDEFFSKIFDVTIRIFGSIAIGIIAFMPFVFNILINENFNDAYYQIPILMVASMFNILVSFLGSIYVAKKLTREIAKTSIFAAIINLVINLILIRTIGLYAASISTFASYFVMFIYRYIDSKKYVKLIVNKNVAVSMVLITILAFIAYYLKVRIVHIAVALVVVAYAVYINRHSAKFIVETIKNKTVTN